MVTADPRPGGRAARVQQAVHEAVRALQAESPRQELTIPNIAMLAGVAPSTVYRRWGGLNALLADVAAARLRPEGPPDTGSVRGDLTAWAEQYLEESASPTGRRFLSDLISGGPDRSSALRAGSYARERVELMLDRGRQRGEDVPRVQEVIDLLLAPIVYQLLFEPDDCITGDLIERLLARLTT